MTRFAAALSVHPLAAEALGQVVGDVLEQLGDGCRPDLVVAFVSSHHLDHAAAIADGLERLLRPTCLVGATAVAVAGGGREVEEQPSLSVLAADFGGVGLRSLVLSAVPTPDGARLVGWPDEVPASGTLVLLADPFTFPVDDFLRLVNDHAPDLTVVGGMASAAMRPGGNRLLHGGSMLTEGAVAVLVPAEVGVRTVVSQGCRPIGRPFTITRADGNVVLELGGQPPLARLQELAASLDDHERSLLRQGLHVGIVVDEHRVEFARGDFLVRNLLGADEDTGAIAIGEPVEVGQTVQFHLRDAESADEDLRHLLRGVEGRAALLFTCNGRGSRLFGVPDHDAGLVEDTLGPLPLAGAFCAGEIGPVGGRSHLHGFTASLALFT
jgi:small ligand-binding sensory domain FIST